MIVGYGPNEGNGEEKKRLWSELDSMMDRVGNGYISGVLGDLNEWIGDEVRASVTGAFGVPGENDNGRREVELCSEKELCVGNTYLEHKSLHKYTTVTRGQDGVKVKIRIDLVLVKKKYAALCAGWEGNERSGTRPLRSPCCDV